jgi:hypothetical protein
MSQGVFKFFKDDEVCFIKRPASKSTVPRSILFPLGTQMKEGEQQGNINANKMPRYWGINPVG